MFNRKYVFTVICIVLAALLLTNCAPAPTEQPRVTPAPPTATQAPMETQVPTETPLPTQTETPAPTLTATIDPSLPLYGKSVLFVIFDRFEEREFRFPKEILEEQGVTIQFASSSLEEVPGHVSMLVQPDVLLTDVDVTDYDAVVYIGGYGYERSNVNAERVAQDAAAQGKILAAICVAPITLAKAGVLEDVNMTSSLSATTFEHLGANFVGGYLQRDGNIITGNGPGAAKAFGEAILEALLELD